MEKDNWVVDDHIHSEQALEEDSELDDVNNETFADAVDVDYAWEEEHRLVASQLEEEKRKQRQWYIGSQVEDKLRLLSLQPQTSQEMNRDTMHTPVGNKDPLYANDIWGTNLFQGNRNDARELQRKTAWNVVDSRRRPNKVLFAQDLERSLLESSQRRTTQVPISRGFLEPTVSGERRDPVIGKVFARQESTSFEKDSALTKKKPWETFSESKKFEDEYPSLKESFKTLDSSRKKGASFFQSSQSNNQFRQPRDISSGHRQKRTGYQKRSDSRHFVRRLYSKWMTCSEIELIAKMHIRQLETSSWPVEDFYCQAYRQKEQRRSEEQLKEYPYSRDTKKKTLRSGYFPHHSENNLKILERALGSIQGYNPNAPRRMVQVALESVSDSSLERDEAHVTDTPFHEDSRIAAQSVISLAFDILFDLEDELSVYSSVAELEEHKTKMSRKLLNTFGITVDENLRDETRNIFSRICALPKGRKLLIRCFSVLPRTYLTPLLNMILFSLGMILKRTSKAQLEEPSWQQFVESVMHFIEETDDISVLTEWTHSFAVGHQENKNFLFVITTGSSLSLVVTLLFSACSLDSSRQPPLKMLLNRLCERLILSVEEMFKHVEHSIVWQLVALLDGFVDTMLREKLRMIIKKLIEEQRITLST
ncbi:hypothetical protein Gasu2_32880 [Galdieria sulphuraria]|uniref:Uncharacterized protein n=1 Tax=Galdieria sulphuraria TaxID=130081 RepID=M2XKF2_GALSU|nr:uncharacterized protein Gasu_20780 [Galdieria sulphuraria]EME30617.1 hypothetical protein Gasu_20780 [Galdieria sulphuraria]GJD09015.1 hypothetical protein Gasu2_32880 [Galdieria sulphuraria]|eukprot:XP_005707137.1 hypothetical protein Gasu_20780 [Galdieria sulphuraria]